MRIACALAVSTLVVLVSAIPLAPSGTEALGCSARPDSDGEDIDDWALTVDGEIVDSYGNDDPEEERSLSPAIRELDTSRIKMAQVICWAAVDRMYGVRLRHGIYSIWTTNVFSGAGEYLREAYALRLEGGDVSAVAPPHPEVEVAQRQLPDGSGFAIELTHPKHQWMCRVANVDLPPHHDARGPDSLRGSNAGTPHCFSLHEHLGSGR